MNSAAIRAALSERMNRAPEYIPEAVDVAPFLLEDEPVDDADSEDVADSLTWRPVPVDTLPGPVADYATAHAAAIGCDVAFVALPCLAVLANAIGTRYRVRLKRSWDEAPTLWVGPIAPSGSAKSPALEAALRPVRNLEREAAAAFRDAMAEYREAMEQYKALPKDERAEAEEPDRPVQHRRIISDVTVESVVDRHAAAPGGLIMARDEGSAWIDGMNQYKKAGADMQSWIELRDGRPVTVDRKTGDTKVYFIARPAVSAVFTSQPSIIQKSLTPAHFNSGFAARLILVMPPVAPRRWTDADVTLEVFDAYDRLVRQLDALPVPGEDSDASIVELSSEARRLFARFVDENGTLMQSLPDGALRAALAKIEATAARLALILHLCDHVTGVFRHGEPGPVPALTMQRAVSLTRWIRHETARVYDLLRFNERAKSDDERLADRLPDPFAWRDVADAAGVERAGAFKIINRLIDGGHVEREAHGKYRRKTMETVDFGYSGDFAPAVSPESLESLQSPPSTESPF